MSTLLARRDHSERWGGNSGTSIGISSGSSPIPIVRHLEASNTFIIDDPASCMKEI